MESRTKQPSATRPASDVKAHWRDIVDEVNAVGEVVVTSYNRPEVVVVSMDRYAKLRKDASDRDPLTTLRAELDHELTALHHPNAAGKLRMLFASAPTELSKAANAAGRRRKR